MRITASKPVPSPEKLIDMLKEHFPSSYRYSVFGLSQSVMVEQSPMVGAQISLHDNEFTVVGTPPSVWSGLLTTITTGLSIPITLNPSTYQKLESEIGNLLTRKFN